MRKWVIFAVFLAIVFGILYYITFGYYSEGKRGGYVTRLSNRGYLFKTYEGELRMGGLFEGGNTTPAAEFNIYVDPEAADLVFHSGIPITQVPLDVTHFMLGNKQRVERFRKLGNRTGVATAEMLEFFERFDEAKYGWDGGPLHDPCVIAWLLKPELFKGKHVNVAIETSSELTRGMTVVDWWGVTGRVKNVTYLRSGDADGFFDLLFERLARLA